MPCDCSTGFNCNQGRACPRREPDLYTADTVLDFVFLAIVSCATAMVIAIPLYLWVTT